MKDLKSNKKLNYIVTDEILVRRKNMNVNQQINRTDTDVKFDNLPAFKRY
jgi:hypothetical protein